MYYTLCPHRCVIEQHEAILLPTAFKEPVVMYHTPELDDWVLVLLGEEQLVFPELGFVTSFHDGVVFRGDGFLLPIVADPAPLDIVMLKERFRFFSSPDELSRIEMTEAPGRAHH